MTRRSEPPQKPKPEPEPEPTLATGRPRDPVAAIIRSAPHADSLCTPPPPPEPRTEQGS